MLRQLSSLHHPRLAGTYSLVTEIDSDMFPVWRRQDDLGREMFVYSRRQGE